MADRWQTLQICLFLTHPPSYLSIPYPGWSNAGNLKLCRRCSSCACMMFLCDKQPGWVGRWITNHSCSQVGSCTDTVTSLQLQEVLLSDYLSSPLRAQDFATWGSTDFKADLAWMNHLSLMCVCYRWKRKEAGILAGWDRRLLAAALSQHIRWRRLFLLSLCIACKLED